MHLLDKDQKLSKLVARVSLDCQINAKQVASVVALLQSSNTVPFIARYRKEVTGNLDEVQIRSIDERFRYVTELEDRRETILQSIESQGKLTDELKAQVLACAGKTELEDLYLPFKPKRRTRAMIAREKGLEPLAMQILAQPLSLDVETCAQAFVNSEKEVPDADSALRGARDIVAEIVAEMPTIRTFVRSVYQKNGKVLSSKRDDVSGPTKFEQYYDYAEPVNQIPSHRYLAIARGERENVLRMKITADPELSMGFIAQELALNEKSAFAGELKLVIEDAYKRLLAPSIETDIYVELKLKSDSDAIDIFAQNLRTILLSAPLGEKTVLGIDPGLRTGCKCAVIENTGKFIENVTIFLTGSGSNATSEKILGDLIAKYNPAAIAVGNGTGGREAEAFVRRLLVDMKREEIVVVSVSESGASVYSASDVAREEFPELDLTVRGAISIARRLQDPLSELVKVEPKAMGVGQYQHDVYQPLLERKLNEVVESCVNQVGVELNTASASLLSYVAGIGSNVAKNIVVHREANGPFKTRKDLKKVAGLGPRTFEQSAGFLRLRGGENPLDASAVHPERYDVVERIAKDMGVRVNDLVGNATLANNIPIAQYANPDIGTLTLKDIIDELKKPGRDPRATFERPAFRDDVSSITDLTKGMILEGVITNVTAFGAFVDIGVHQDGLIHISELSDKFVKNPSDIAHAGDKIKVEVLDVDVPRKRISLSARINRNKEGIRPNQQKTQHPKPTSNATLGSIASFANLTKRL